MTHTRTVCVVFLAIIAGTGCGSEQERATPEETAVPPVVNAPEPDTPTVFDAVQSGDTALLLELHADGAAIDALNPDGLIPLQLAIEQGDLPMVETLLNLGVDPDGAPSEREPPINIAIRRAKAAEAFTTDHPEWAILRLLIRRGARMTRHHNGYISAVQYAMEIRCEPCIDAMREAAFARAVVAVAGLEQIR